MPQLPEVPRAPRHHEAPLHQRHGVLAPAADLDARQRNLRAHPRGEAVDVSVLHAPPEQLSVGRQQHAFLCFNILCVECVCVCVYRFDHYNKVLRMSAEGRGKGAGGTERGGRREREIRWLFTGYHVILLASLLVRCGVVQV